MGVKKRGSIKAIMRKRLVEAKSEEEIKLLNGALDRLSCLQRAETGDVDALIELGQEIWGTKND
jgi:hypothetical protein